MTEFWITSFLPNMTWHRFKGRGWGENKRITQHHHHHSSSWGQTERVNNRGSAAGCCLQPVGLFVIIIIIIICHSRSSSSSLPDDLQVKLHPETSGLWWWWWWWCLSGCTGLLVLSLVSRHHPHFLFPINYSSRRVERGRGRSKRVYLQFQIQNKKGINCSAVFRII